MSNSNYYYEPSTNKMENSYMHNSDNYRTPTFRTQNTHCYNTESTSYQHSFNESRQLCTRYPPVHNLSGSNYNNFGPHENMPLTSQNTSVHSTVNPVFPHSFQPPQERIRNEPLIAPFPPPPLPPPSFLPPRVEFPPSRPSNMRDTLPSQSYGAPRMKKSTGSSNVPSRHTEFSRNQTSQMPVSSAIYENTDYENYEQRTSAHDLLNFPSSHNEEEKWICEWTEKVEKRINLNKKTKDQLKVNEIQKKLFEHLSLIDQLEGVVEDLSHCESDATKFQELFQKAQEIKNPLNSMWIIYEKMNLPKLKEELSNRRSKRLRHRKNKKRRTERHRKLKEEWKEKERMIDEQLKRLHEEEKNKIREEKVKEDADLVLREVRTKQEEAQKMQRLLLSLAQLRNARIKKGEVHGFVTSPQGNTFFAKVEDEFKHLLSSQLDLYRGEEQTLKVMMEESNVTLSKSFRKPHRDGTSVANKLIKQISEALFGEAPPSSSSEKNNLRSLFTAAEESFEMLVKRRTEWDQYIDMGSPSGLGIPLNWVIPNVEPDPDWKRFQHKTA